MRLRARSSTSLTEPLCIDFSASPTSTATARSSERWIVTFSSMVWSARAIAASSRLRRANRLLSPWPIDHQLVDRALDLLVGEALRGLGDQVGGGLEAVLHRHQRGGVLGDHRFAEQAGDEVGLRRDFERAAQAGDLHRHEVLHQLAGALHGVLALHHDVEVEVVDQADQQVGELLVRAEHVVQPLLVVAAVARLEVRELGEARAPFPSAARTCCPPGASRAASRRAAPRR